MRDVIPGDVVVFKGRHSKVVAFTGLKVVVKVFPEKLKKNAQKEIEALRLARKYGIDCVPKYFGHVETDDAIFVVKEFIEGLYFVDFIKTCNEKMLARVLLKLLKCLNLMDRINLVVKELSSPKKNIVISGEKPYLIDLERLVYSSGKTNVTQFLGFIYSISSSKDPKLIEKFSSVFDIENLKEVSKEYKKTIDFEIVKKAFRMSFLSL